MMNKPPLDLTHDFFQLMKQMPRPILDQKSFKNMTRSECELLAMLKINIDDENKAFTVTELSHLLQITPAGVTHLINPLEESEYIERLRDPKDRRVVLIGLTAKGREVAENLISEVQEKLTGLITYLGEEDSRTLIRLMSSVIDYFKEQSFSS